MCPFNYSVKSFVIGQTLLVWISTSVHIRYMQHNTADTELTLSTILYYELFHIIEFPNTVSRVSYWPHTATAVYTSINHWVAGLPRLLMFPFVIYPEAFVCVTQQTQSKVSGSHFKETSLLLTTSHLELFAYFSFLHGKHCPISLLVLVSTSDIGFWMFTWYYDSHSTNPHFYFRDTK